MMLGVRLDGMKVGNKPIKIPQARFHWEVLILVQGVSPNRVCEWAKMNLDMGAVVSTFPLNFGPDGAGDGRFY